MRYSSYTHKHIHTHALRACIIEHNMPVIMGLADEIYCLANGRVLAKGTPDEIQNNQDVINAYLGAH